jgi:type 2A phosphatase activator TIP41
VERRAVHDDIKEIVKPFDWSYSTDYKGTILLDRLSHPEPSKYASFEATEKQLPIALLVQPDPILFFSSIDLFEDELADNGMSLLTAKVRVMPKRLLLLCRFFLRLDGVVFRIRDTRVYIEFETGEVIREYTAREESYDAIKTKIGSGVDATSFMRDPDQLCKLCPVVETKLETLVLPSFA